MGTLEDKKPDTDDTLVVVRRQWNDWRQAKVKFSALDGIRWDRISGGVGAPAPQPFIHGYIWPDAIVEGEVAYSGRHQYNTIKVCVVKKDNSREIFAKLVEIAGPKPGKARRKKESE